LEIEKVKTVTVKEFYKFVKTTNLMGYIESEAALIRVIRKMVEGTPAKALYFDFFDVHGKTLTFKINVKDLEN